MTAARQTRAEKTQARRDAILEAAVAEFVASGYAAARVEDIAARAHVAKGTVYLAFPDKEALFVAAVRSRMGPVGARLATSMGAEKATVRETMEGVLGTALALLSDPRIGEVLRLVIAESIRFPALTGFYRRELIAPLAARCGQLLKKAAASGELTTPATAEFPHLGVAPLIVSVVARGALREIGVTDLDAMLKAHLDGLFAGRAER
jgi:AcrR family transcriptional regulator